jgi:hypothetical protein
MMKKKIGEEEDVLYAFEGLSVTCTTTAKRMMGRICERSMHIAKRRAMVKSIFGWAMGIESIIQDFKI